MTFFNRLGWLPGDVRVAWGWAVAWAALAAVLDAACGLVLVPLLTAWFSDGVLPWGWVSALLGLTGVQALTMYMALRRGYLAGGGLAAGLLGHLVRQLPRVSPRALRRVVLPEHLLRGPVQQSMGIPAHLLGPLLSAVLTPACVVLGLLFIDARMALVLLFAGLLCVLALRWASRHTLAAEEARLAAERSFARQVQAFAERQALLRVAAQAGIAGQGLAQTLDGLRDSTALLLRRGLPAGLGLSLAVQGVFATMLLGGVGAVAHRALDGAQLIAVLILLVRFIEPLAQLSHLDQALRGGWQALDALLQVLALPALASPEHGEIPKDASLAAEALGVRLDDGGELLSDVDLFLVPGSLTVLVGPSGAGKSSLLALLGRLYDPDDGCVRMGQVDARRLSESTLAASRNLVFQDNGLFRGSVAWNLRMAEPDASTQELRAAAERAGLLADIDAWPRQWETPVGPSGNLLSGGQRQRLCLARAFLSRAPLLLLDEPTASLDAISETQVLRSLAALKGQRTVLAVTHRPALARLADQVLVLQAGRLTAHGTHAELCTRDAWYARFAGHGGA